MVTRKILIALQLALQQFFANTGLKQGRPSCRQPGFFWIKDVSSSGDRHRTFRAWWTANKLELPCCDLPTNWGTTWFSQIMLEKDMIEWLAREGEKAILSRLSRPGPAEPATTVQPVTGFPPSRCYIVAMRSTRNDFAVHALRRCNGDAQLGLMLSCPPADESVIQVFEDMADGSMRPIKVRVETCLKFG